MGGAWGANTRADKPCETCGTMLYGATACQKYCPECALERKRARARAAYKTEHEDAHTVKRCEMCGEPMPGAYYTRRFCGPCKHKRDNNAAKFHGRKRKAAVKEAAAKSPPKPAPTPTAKTDKYTCSRPCIWRNGYYSQTRHGQGTCNWSFLNYSPRGCSIAECDKFVRIQSTRKLKKTWT